MGASIGAEAPAVGQFNRQGFGFVELPGIESGQRRIDAIEVLFDAGLLAVHRRPR